jgi:probable metal-binding protein
MLATQPRKHVLIGGNETSHTIHIIYMTHGHEVLHMMEGNSYTTKQQLIDAIVGRFGAEERFCTCSAEGMTAAELVDFLEERGKFMPASEAGGFTVDTDKMCNH